MVLTFLLSCQTSWTCLLKNGGFWGSVFMLSPIQINQNNALSLIRKQVYIVRIALH